MPINGNKCSQTARTNGDGNRHQKPNAVHGWVLLAPGVPSTDRGSHGTPKRALLPLKALTGCPLCQAEPDVPNSVTATGALTPYPGIP